jgi:hypothetical protein
MTIRSQPMAANCERPAADSAAGSAKASHTALAFMLVLQTMIVEEGVFVGRELLDRAVTETHLLSEFLSKMAGSHSVRDLKTMWEECGQHQIDFYSPRLRTVAQTQRANDSYHIEAVRVCSTNMIKR